MTRFTRRKDSKDKEREKKANPIYGQSRVDCRSRGLWEVGEVASDF